MAKGSFPTLAALKAAYPTGTSGDFLVLADNKMYEWTSSAWNVKAIFKREPLALDWNVVRYGASGSQRTTTCLTTAGSNVVTLSSLADFEVGQDVAIDGAAAVNSVTFMEVTSPPTAPGTVSLTADGKTVTATVNPLAQIFEFTFTGQAENLASDKLQFGISLEYDTKYVTMLPNETAVQFANRLRTDGYFTNYWPGWTISGTAGTAVVRFTSKTTGPRLWGTQAFANAGMNWTVAQIQAGTGDKGTIAYRLADVMKMEGFVQSRLDEVTAVATRNIVGTAPAPVFNAGTTGCTVAIRQPINGIGELIATITAIDYATNKITLSKAADYKVSYVTARHDDTRAIQQAINDCSAAGGGRVHLPDGLYRHTGLYFKDKVNLLGSSISGTVLYNHHALNHSIQVHGIGGSLDDYTNPTGFMDHWTIANMTITTGKVGNPFYLQDGISMLFCHTCVIRDVKITNHAKAIFEKCVWYGHFENIMCSKNIDGWYYPSFNPSNSPSARYNVYLIDNSRYGMFVENSPDVFIWIGGAVERNLAGGLYIYGGECRTMSIEGVNFEENGNYQIEIGKINGAAPSNISVRNCSFKNWQTAKPECAIKLNRVAGFELHNPKFFYFDIAVKAENTGSSFIITLPSFDGCRKAYKFTDNEVSASEGYHMVVGDWSGVLGYTSIGFRQLGSQAQQTPLISLREIATLLGK